MIPAVHARGTRVAGLLRYLFGPGKREEHVNPHVVAAWDGAGPLGDDVQQLTELLEQPVRSGRNPPAKTVWHCSIRTHPDDRSLSDSQWGHIASDVMAAVGLAPHGDASAVRWIAVRHNDDHIHLVATLVRQDLRTAWAWKDKLHAQQACRDLEERYGLHRVAGSGRGARGWPSPSEIKKADRLGQARPARVELRSRVRAAAASAVDESDFFTRLDLADVLVKRRLSNVDPSVVTGYAVALPQHTTAAGDAIWYSGGRLGADLTLPRLRAHWKLNSTVIDALETLAMSRREPFAHAAQWLKRATRGGSPASPRMSALARVIATAARMTDDEDFATALQLVQSMTAFAEQLAEIRDAPGQRTQADAARRAAEWLRSHGEWTSGPTIRRPTTQRRSR